MFMEFPWPQNHHTTHAATAKPKINGNDPPTVGTSQQINVGSSTVVRCCACDKRDWAERVEAGSELTSSKQEYRACIRTLGERAQDGASIKLNAGGFARGLSGSRCRACAAGGCIARSLKRAKVVACPGPRSRPCKRAALDVLPVVRTLQPSH